MGNRPTWTNTKNTYEYGSDGNLTVLKAYVSDGDNAEEMLLYNRYEFKFNNLNTDNIMLPSSETGYYNNYYDFYEHEFYTNGAIDEVKHSEYEYTSESLELQKQENITIQNTTQLQLLQYILTILLFLFFQIHSQTR